jgi:hypothetical protein
LGEKKIPGIQGLSAKAREYGEKRGLKDLCKGGWWGGGKGKGRGFGQKESCRGEDLVMSGHEQVVIPAPALGHIQEATHCQVCQRP